MGVSTTLLERVGVIVKPDDYDNVLSSLISEESKAYRAMLDAQFELGCEVQYWGFIPGDPEILEIKTPTVERLIARLHARQSIYERCIARRRAYQALYNNA